MILPLSEKLYYTIGEVANAFKVNASLIRFWEKEFEILKPKKNKKGTRYFTQQDIKNLALIYHLVKEKGYTLEGAKIALQDVEKIDKNLTIISRLEFIRKKLSEIKQNLDNEIS